MSLTNHDINKYDNGIDSVDHPPYKNIPLQRKINIDSVGEFDDQRMQSSDIVRIAAIIRLALAQQKQIILLTNHDINKNDNDIDNADRASSAIQ